MEPGTETKPRTEDDDRGAFPSVGAVRESRGVIAGAPALDYRGPGWLRSGGRLRIGERIIEFLLFLAGSSSILITVGIVGILVYEASGFFEHVSIKDFLTDTQWTPLFEDAHYGILPLLSGTLLTTAVALVVAIPVGTISAIWLSEYAPKKLREVIKPALELLGAVPTVVYGYFAFMFVTPFLQTFMPNLPGFNMLSAGLVIGLMIIPYISSLSEDAMHAVPMHMREGSYAMGATRMQTALRVIVPASLSGITAAYILGVSRAVGETMVVAIAAGTQPNLTADPTQPGATITAFIVQVSLGDLPHGSIGYQSIFAAGLALMLLTLLFNIGGYILRSRYRQAY
jgi:phosphate transport system permease protein